MIKANGDKIRELADGTRARVEHYLGKQGKVQDLVRKGLSEPQWYVYCSNCWRRLTKIKT